MCFVFEHQMLFHVLYFCREFQDLACGVLNQCYTDKPELTDQILTRKRPRWRNLSCLEIAYKMKVYPFMSHEACKIPINRVWFGKISPNTSAVQVNMFIFIVCINILNSSKSLLFVQLFCSELYLDLHSQVCLTII